MLSGICSGALWCSEALELGRSGDWLARQSSTRLSRCFCVRSLFRSLSGVDPLALGAPGSRSFQRAALAWVALALGGLGPLPLCLVFARPLRRPARSGTSAVPALGRSVLRAAPPLLQAHCCSSTITWRFATLELGRLRARMLAVFFVTCFCLPTRLLVCLLTWFLVWLRACFCV